jgi:hypothetical protein
MLVSSDTGKFDIFKARGVVRQAIGGGLGIKR